MRDESIMASHDEGERTPSGHSVEMVVRTLRHEIGDLLQSVYSAVAILQERLPRGQNLERTILTDLRGRAETCKNELDAAHDLVCPLSLNLDSVELSELAAGVAASFSLRYPGLQIVCEAPRPVKVWGDAPKLGQVGTLLMMALCPAARSKVLVRVAAQPENGNAEWSFTHDGPPANAEQLSWLTAPFSTTRHARFGLGLAFARRVVEAQGGRITAGDTADESFQVTMFLPSDAPQA
jgi:signal transduction histidine kinase